MEILKEALAHCANGRSIIPIKPKDKMPLVKWEPFQHKRATPNQIKEWWTKWPNANLALVTGSISGIVALDADSAKGYRALIELLPTDFLTPESKTPKGRHLFVKHTDGLGNATRFIEDCDYRGEGGYIIVPPSLGANGEHYEWLSGKSIFEIAPAPLPEAVVNILKQSIYRGNHKKSQFAEKENNHSKSQIVTDSHISLNKGHRDDALFHLANYLVKGGMPLVNIEKYLSFFASYCSPPFPKKEIPAKIKSALKRTQKTKGNIAEDLRRWVLVTEGHFLVTEYHAESQIVTPEDKHAVIVALSRLEKEGIVEKYGSKRGCYRRVDKECETIDWQHAEDAPFNLEWPFALEKFALLYPKNIAIIAGTQNAGKTALALNIAYMNREQMKIRYLSSEMGKHELKGRLKKFNYSLEDWKLIDFKERSSNFADVILPDGLNIIDYYEISKDFWLIADDLKKIYEKLKSGIAIICLQKTEGKSEGRGGDFGLEKPRLYLNVDQDPPDGAVLTIRKGKNWAQEGKNPNWYKVRFKILSGAKLLQQGDWYLE